MFMPFSFLMVFLLVFGSLLSLSSVSWLGIWAGLELNMLCFIPVLSYLSGFQVIEGMVKYFLVQSFGSIILLFSGLVVSSGFVYIFSDFFYLVFVSLFLKLGLFPFHWWLPTVLSSLGWFGVFLLSTWQKVGPFFLFLFFSGVSYFFFFFSSFSALVGGICGIGQTSYRFLLAYSTIGHLGWMISVGFYSFFFAFFYFFVYFFFSVVLIFFFWYFDVSRFVQVFSFSLFFVFFLMICLMSLSGVPPFLGFFSKFFSFFKLLEQGGSFLLVFFLLAGSLFSLYFYLGMFFSFFFFSFSFFCFDYKFFKIFIFFSFSFVFFIFFFFFFFDFFFLNL
uniref:NADH-ubiquinone oxidoreductase chain 2 n=1 Tax=Nemertopsis sp. WYS-2013 TaxID=1432317 RepID=A0A0A7ADN2_9BILA|nr:NADH dehydrogenase subunit 2 [Nemertopsis sp. WYS-2013]